MRITQNGKALLLKATSSLGKSQNVIVELLTSLAESHAWFHEYLFAVLNNGVTIITAKINVFARYDFVDRTVIINSDYLPTSLTTAPTIIVNALKLVLRHELTHAFDAKDKEKNPNDIVFLMRLLSTQKIAATIYDMLSCVDRHHQVDSKKLDDIATTLSLTETHSGGYVTYLSDNLTTKGAHAIQNHIDYIGFMRSKRIENGRQTNFPTHVTDIWQIDTKDQFILLSTEDYALLKNLFETTRRFRQENNALSVEQDPRVLEVLDDTKRLNMWGQLSTKQRVVLDRLYMLRHRFHSQLKQDTVCFPKFSECLFETTNPQCLETFLECQRKTNNDNYIISHYEFHAVLRENTEGYLLTEKLLQGLCTPPVKPLESERRTLQVNPKPASSTTKSPASTQVSDMSLMLKSGLNSFGYCLIDTLAESYLEAKEFKRIPLWKIFINVGYMLFSYSFLYYISLPEKDEANSSAQEALLLISFTLIHNGLKMLNNVSLGKWPSRMFTAGLFASQAATQGPIVFLKTLGASIAGGTIGGLCAESMAKGLGWQNTYQKVTRDMQHNTAKTSTAMPHPT